MTKDELRAIVIAELRNLTPETDPAEIAGDADIREALDFDSMDVLNFVTALSKRLGVDLPEADYPLVNSVDGAADYLARRLRPAVEPGA